MSDSQKKMSDSQMKMRDSQLVTSGFFWDLQNFIKKGVFNFEKSVRKKQVVLEKNSYLWGYICHGVYFPRNGLKC